MAKIDVKLCKVNLQSQSILSRVRAYFEQHGQGSCPDMAASLGLSRVSVGLAIKQLMALKELRELAAAPSRGGRRARVYGYEGRAELSQLLWWVREQRAWRAHFEQIGAKGRRLRHKSALFSYITPENIASWLEGEELSRLSLYAPAHPELDKQLAALKLPRLHLASSLCAQGDCAQSQWVCCFLKGEPPQAALLQSGHISPCANLALLPLPASWQEELWQDLPLLEEMVSRLCMCLFAMAHADALHLYIEGLSDKLDKRIRYNLAQKMSAKLGFRLTMTALDEGLALQSIRLASSRAKPKITG